jgi:hypothetical protein
MLRKYDDQCCTRSSSLPWSDVAHDPYRLIIGCRDTHLKARCLDMAGERRWTLIRCDAFLVTKGSRSMGISFLQGLV